MRMENKRPISLKNININILDKILAIEPNDLVKIIYYNQMVYFKYARLVQHLKINVTH